jgi:diguanylate cyclase (GGDEF)-like protein/PAS domain S-box-containing protein
MNGTIWLLGGASTFALASAPLLWRAHARLRRVSSELRVTQERLAAIEAVATPVPMLTTQEWLALPARSAQDALWDWDLTHDRMRFSSRWRELVGLDPQDIERSTDEWWGRVHPADRAQLQVDITAQMAGAGDRFTAEHRVRHEDGRWLRVQWNGLIVRGPEGRALRAAGSVRDTTHQRSMEEEARRGALYDSLTGLPNRTLAFDLLRRAIARTRRHGERRFAALLVDVDRFNLLNDSLGHTVGDELLRGIAKRLGTAVRPGDVIARLGSDEFLLILDEINDISEAESVADRVALVLADAILVTSHSVVISASVGIALYDPDCAEPADYLRDAELAMKRAKDGGRARHERFLPEMRDGVRRRVSLEQDLHGAIERDEMMVWYQPIFAVHSDAERLVGFEALIRWNHPRHGLLGPASFVPVAEETGMIIPLGAWVLRRACEELLELAPNAPGAPWVSVNVAARQLADRALVDMVDAALRDSGLEATRLKLEVTENVILSDEAGARVALESLRARGVRSLMDDFGTGHASLSYLHRLPIGTIKIDRYFVGRMDVSPECLEIVRSVITLARSLGMEVVAEGVEQETHLSQLRTLGCEYAQGFLLARPMPAADAHDLMLARAAGRSSHGSSLNVIGNSTS